METRDPGPATTPTHEPDAEAPTAASTVDATQLETSTATCSWSSDGAAPGIRTRFPLAIPPSTTASPPPTTAMPHRRKAPVGTAPRRARKHQWVTRITVSLRTQLAWAWPTSRSFR